MSVRSCMEMQNCSQKSFQLRIFPSKVGTSNFGNLTPLLSIDSEEPDVTTVNNKPVTPVTVEPPIINHILNNTTEGCHSEKEPDVTTVNNKPVTVEPPIVNHILNSTTEDHLDSKLTLLVQKEAIVSTTPEHYKELNSSSLESILNNSEVAVQKLQKRVVP